MSGKRTPAIYFTFPSTQVEDFLPINHEDANYCGHFVGFPIIKPLVFMVVQHYFEILGEKIDKRSAFLLIQVEFYQV